MLIALLLGLALQDPGATQAKDLSRLELHELVAQIPRSGEPETEQVPRSGDPFQLDYVPTLRELRRRIASGTTLDLACWQTILIDKGYLRWRRKWPASIPFSIELRLPPIQDSFALELVAELPHSAPMRCTLGAPMCCFDARPEPRLGRLTPGHQTVQLQVRPYYASGSASAVATQRVLTVGTLSIEVESVERVEDAIEGAADPALGRVLANALRVEDFPTTPCLVASELDWPAGLTGSIDVEVLHGGKLVDAVEWFGARGSARQRVLSLGHLPHGLAAGIETCRGWTLRLRGTSKRVLRDWNATQYWAGEIVVPLADLIRR